WESSNWQNQVHYSVIICCTFFKNHRGNYETCILIKNANVPELFINNKPDRMQNLSYLKSGLITILMTIRRHRFGQDVSVIGLRTDDTGEPIPGAAVLVKGTTIAVAADMDGRYALAVPANAVLVFSFIGFQSQEIPVGNQNIINVSLVPDMSDLEEVVVVGY